MTIHAAGFGRRQRRVVLLAMILGATHATGHEASRAASVAAADPRETKALAGAASLHAAAPPAPTADGTCQMTIRLVDSITRQPLDGLVRVLRGDAAVPLPGLVNRGIRLRANHPGKDWHALTGTARVPAPRARLTVEAFAGLHTELARATVEADAAEVTIELPLAPIFQASQKNWYAGNTHLHLNTLTRGQADEYLRTLPRADALDVVFVSHLERAKADQSYITNAYSRAELEQLGNERLRFGNGEEHRHNFERNSEGYGHVMFLDLPRLVQPVSIGAMIAGAGPDWPPLRRGIDEARSQGATVVWCHNSLGFEDVPAWVGGAIAAQNIFDGGSQGSYADTFYRYLDIGLKVPFSTGTDWFLYDFSRVYARIEGPPTVRSWLAALAAGRTFITNGPWLELRVDALEIGDTLRLEQPATPTVRGSARGRHDFKAIELVHDGHVVHSAAARFQGGHFEAKFEFALAVDRPGWIALRVPGGSLDSTGAVAVPSGLPVRGSGPRNELGEPLFAHTSPVYVEFRGRGVFRPSAAEALLAEMEAAIQSIAAKGRFDTEVQREEVLQVYREGIRALRRRMDSRSP